MKRILLVDDEQNVLQALRQLFADGGYNVYQAGSGSEALQVLAEQDVDMIVSDLAMPGMDGHQLLRQAKRLYPRTIRIILGRQVEDKELFRCLLDGSAKMSLGKPWNNGILLDTVKRLFAVRDTLTANNLLAIISKFDGIPAVASVYQRLCALIEKDADMGAIAAAIEEDPAIAVKVLQLTNAAFYSIKTGSVKQAVMYLGLGVVKNLVLTANVFDCINFGVGTKLNKLILWKHAVDTNRMTNLIYEELLGRKLPESVSTAGLLADVGLVLMLKQYLPKYMEMLGTFNPKEGKSLADLEYARLGISHREIGGYLLDWWDIPFPIVECALFHHAPLASPVINRELVAVVHLADYYAWQAAGKSYVPEPDAGVFEFLGVTADQCQQLAAGL